MISWSPTVWHAFTHSQQTRGNNAAGDDTCSKSHIRPLMRMASRQTATTAISCSIWPHEILAFTTSAFPSFYTSYSLYPFSKHIAHFQVFTVQSHATQLTALCADTLCELYFSLVIFTSGYICLGGGGGRIRCFCVGICEESYINPFFFRKKFLKYPDPTPSPTPPPA